MSKMKSRKLRARERQTRKMLEEVFTVSSKNHYSFADMPKDSFMGNKVGDRVFENFYLTAVEGFRPSLVRTYVPVYKASPSDTKDYDLGKIDERLKYLEQEVFPEHLDLDDVTKTRMRKDARQWVNGWYAVKHKDYDWLLANGYTVAPSVIIEINISES